MEKRPTMMAIVGIVIVFLFWFFFMGRKGAIRRALREKVADE
jgi:hypothetical protein